MIFLYILIALLIIIFALSYYIAHVVFHPHVFDYEKTKEIEIDKDFMNLDYLKQFKIEEHSIDYKGKLDAHYINQNSDKTMIIMHGYTYSKYGSYKYAKLFLEKGYNVLMPDQRMHGLSEGDICSLGYFEHLDLLKWIEYAKTLGTINTLGLHGESMGAATVLMASEKSDDIDFIISDCSFSTLKRQIEDRLWNDMKIPKFIIYPTHIVSKIVFKIPLLKVNPKDSIKVNHPPTLFIHGNMDTYIGLEHLNELLEYKQETDSVYICEGANHAESYMTNREKYKEEVLKFLDTLGGNNE